MSLQMPAHAMETVPASLASQAAIGYDSMPMCFLP
jgi:hypothetical protein